MTPRTAHPPPAVLGRGPWRVGGFGAWPMTPRPGLPLHKRVSGQSILATAKRPAHRDDVAKGELGPGKAPPP